jgi:phosphohistidine phosphatase
MRRLAVVRHAKALRDSARGDHGRELSGRGRAEAAALRAWTERGGPLAALRGTVVVSDAARTLETFELGLAGTPCCERAVVDPSLYNGRRHVATVDVLAALAAADPGRGDLFVVAHNPTVLEVVCDLATRLEDAHDALGEGFPLCGVAVLAFADDAVAEQAGVLEALLAPPRGGPTA